MNAPARHLAHLIAAAVLLSLGSLGSMGCSMDASPTAQIGSTSAAVGAASSMPPQQNAPQGAPSGSAQAVPRAQGQGVVDLDAPQEIANGVSAPVSPRPRPLPAPPDQNAPPSDDPSAQGDQNLPIELVDPGDCDECNAPMATNY